MSLAYTAGFAAVRGVLLVFLLVSAGCLCADALGASISNTRISVCRDRANGWLAPLLLSIGLLDVVRMYLQMLSFKDPSDPLTSDLVSAVLLHSGWGHNVLLQTVVALVAGVACICLRVSPRRAVASVAVFVMLAAQTGTGHAAAKQWPLLSGRVLDLAHLVGIAAWLGTLSVFLFAYYPMLATVEEGSALATMIRRFSWLARIGSLMVIVSGTIETLVYARNIPVFIASTWGRLLLVKLVCMLGVVYLGWFNWRVVTPALERADSNAAHRLRQAVWVELSLALAMLAITTLLVVSPLPGEV